MSKSAQKKGLKLYYRGLECNEQGNWGLAEVRFECNWLIPKQEAFLRALVIFQKLRITDQIVCCYESLGNVCFSKGNLSETKKHWINALEIYEQLHQKINAGKVCLDVGDLHYDMKDWYGAGEYYTRAMTLFEEEPLGSEKYQAKANHKLGNVCFNQNRFPDAEKHYCSGTLQHSTLMTALPVYIKLGKTHYIADIYKGIGQIYLAVNDLDVAYKNFKNSFQIYSSMQNEDQKKDVSGYLLAIENKIAQKALEREKKQLERKLEVGQFAHWQ